MNKPFDLLRRGFLRGRWLRIAAGKLHVQPGYQNTLLYGGIFLLLRVQHCCYFVDPENSPGSGIAKYPAGDE